MLDSPIKIVKTESCVLMCVCVEGGCGRFWKPNPKQLHVGGGENSENTKHIKKYLPTPEKAYDLLVWQLMAQQGSRGDIWCFIHIIIRWISAEAWCRCVGCVHAEGSWQRLYPTPMSVNTICVHQATLSMNKSVSFGVDFMWINTFCSFSLWTTVRVFNSVCSPQSN